MGSMRLGDGIVRVRLGKTELKVSRVGMGGIPINGHLSRKR